MTSLPITSAQDVQYYGAMIAQSGMFGADSEAQGVAIVLMCHQQGQSLLEYQRTFHLVGGKPSMKADVMLAKLLEYGGGYEVLERSETVAHIKAWRQGNEANPFELRLTIEQAIEQKLPFKGDGRTFKNTWQNYPRAMLWARASSEAVRVVEPRVNAGIYAPEELDDDANPAPIEPTDPFAAIPPDPVDYDIVPFGPSAGKRWFDLGREVLMRVKADPKTLTKEHLQAVDAALERLPF